MSGSDYMMEQWKEQCHRELEEWKENCRREMVEWVESFKVVNMAGQAAIKSAILINGGAAVALLAFTGHVFTTSQDSEVTAKLACAMAFFVGGILFGAVASGVVYLGLFVYKYYKRAGHVLNGISWLLVISCYILFVIGAVLAFRVF